MNFSSGKSIAIVCLEEWKCFNINCFLKKIQEILGSCGVCDVAELELTMCLFLRKITPVDWPFEEGGNGTGAKERSIADYLATNKFDLVINLPLRSSGARRASTYFTHGYKTRRMAIDYSVPLITDIKCAKLFIEVRTWRLCLTFIYPENLFATCSQRQAKFVINGRHQFLSSCKEMCLFNGL